MDYYYTSKVLRALRLTGREALAKLTGEHAMPQAQIKQRIQRRKRNTPRSSMSIVENQNVLTTSKDQLHTSRDAITCHQASQLLVDVFITEECDMLHPECQKTLRNLAQFGVKLDALIQLVHRGALKILLLEELLVDYIDINIKQAPYSELNIPDEAELIRKANRLLLRDFTTLEFTHLRPSQCAFLANFIDEGLTIAPVLSALINHQNHTLLLLTIAEKIYHLGKYKRLQQLLDFLLLPPFQNLANKAALDTDIQLDTDNHFQIALKKAQGYGLQLPENNVSQIKHLFNDQIRAIAAATSEEISTSRLGKCYLSNAQNRTYTFAPSASREKAMVRNRPPTACLLEQRQTNKMGTNQSAEINTAGNNHRPASEENPTKVVSPYAKIYNEFNNNAGQTSNRSSDQNVSQQEEIDKDIISSLFALLLGNRLLMKIEHLNTRTLNAFRKKFYQIQRACDKSSNEIFHIISRITRQLNSAMNRVTRHCAGTFKSFCLSLRTYTTPARKALRKLHAKML